MNPIRLVKAWRAYTRLQRAWKVFAMKKEPVAIAGVIRAAAYLGAIFGFDLTEQQILALIVVGELLFGVWVRARVSPVAS